MIHNLYIFDHVDYFIKLTTVMKMTAHPQLNLISNESFIYTFYQAH